LGNAKIKIVSRNTMPRRQSAGRKSSGAGGVDTSLGPAPEEGLRLIRAFSRINDPAWRTRLIEEVEKHARN